ncbi:hypothetical protein TraAM80_04034 [Trypanosoma rangeli]|uniref:Uncharacterized protein n=1 Tax=Trypanosoma rangeli TaxID=5698 RepID=A0A3S5IRF1_TRYRA|nr:uncharacterized protein TraAM80_04034 [Trypanosoma rangeli]RNF06337.1 hypothetical protein TraAM80_04034 [Trypanosoma rangeli]|eukprot:RNF06337.1 hypothetical protein TraAM80_04034 [Trypanosoma rangeli]
MNLCTSDESLAFGYSNGYRMVGNINALDNVLLTPNLGNANGADRRPEQKPLLPPTGKGNSCVAVMAPMQQQHPTPRGGSNKNINNGGGAGDANTNDIGPCCSKEPTHTTIAKLSKAHGEEVNMGHPGGNAAAKVHKPTTITRAYPSRLKPNIVPILQQQPKLLLQSVHIVNHAVGKGGNTKCISVGPPLHGRCVAVRNVFGNTTSTLQERCKVTRQAGEEVKRKLPATTDDVRVPTLNSSVPIVPGPVVDKFVQRKIAAACEAILPVVKETLRMSNTAPVSVCIMDEALDNEAVVNQFLRRKDGLMEKPQEQIETSSTKDKNIIHESRTHITPNAPKSATHTLPVVVPVKGNEGQPKAPPPCMCPEIDQEVGKLEPKAFLHPPTRATTMGSSRMGSSIRRSEDSDTGRSPSLTASTNVDGQRRCPCGPGRNSILIKTVFQSQVDLSAEKKRAMEAWAGTPLLMQTPPPSPSSSSAATIEYAGEQMELHYTLHNVIAQLFHRNRPQWQKYPEKMPLVLEKIRRPRCPHTPRSFYGVKGMLVSPDWFCKALDDVQRVKSPDLGFLDAAEGGAKNPSQDRKKR